MVHDDAPTGEGLKVDERTRRILDAAVQLAEAGGFAAVRLRDVAQGSGVALGTLYKRFRSKEDLLVGVLSQELHDLRLQLAQQPVQGATPEARVVGFFRFLTDFLCRRPNLGRAVVRSAAAGEQALSERLARFHADLFELSFNAMLGGPDRAPTPGETVMLSALQQIWFSALCGWAGSLYDRAEVVVQVAAAARLMLHGVERMPLVDSDAAGPLRVWQIGGAGASQLEDGRVELVDAGALRLQELLARDEVDVVQVEGAADERLELDAQWRAPSGCRPRVVVLMPLDAALAGRLVTRVDAVIGCAPDLPVETAREVAAKLYLALARGGSLRDAFDEAREGAPAEAVSLVARAGADLRALSLR